MKRHSVRLGPLHRTALYGALGLLAGTGVLWKIIQMRDEAATASESLHALRPVLMTIHGYAAFLFDVAAGAVLTGHVKRSWSYGDNRANGAFFTALLGLLALAGHSLYYVGGEEWRWWLGRLHFWGGVSLPFFLLLHILLGRRAVAAALAAPEPAESSPR